MGSLSADKAGVGSAVNDTTRELGGTLGVADRRQRVQLGLHRVRSTSTGGVFADVAARGAGRHDRSRSAPRGWSRELGADAPAYLAQVNDAFLSGLHVGCFVAAGVAAAGAVFALRFLPARAT